MAPCSPCRRALDKLWPRQGRYARVGFAIVAYFVSSNVSASKSGWRRAICRPRSACGGCMPRPWGSACTCYARCEEGMDTLDRVSLSHRARLTAHGDGRCCWRWGALGIFISQQDDLGVGNYSGGDAFLFTLLESAEQAFELLPIGAMIGALMGSDLAAAASLWSRGFGRIGLAHRVAGGSRGPDLSRDHVRHRRLCSPSMAQFAKREKTISHSADVSLQAPRSAWAEAGNRILRVQSG